MAILHDMMVVRGNPRTRPLYEGVWDDGDGGWMGAVRNRIAEGQDNNTILCWLGSAFKNVEADLERLAHKPNGPGPAGELSAGGLTVEWDVFISHASEDKEAFVRPLAVALREKGIRVWFDEFTLTVGDSLRRSIDDGLVHSRYGIVVISPDFLKKDWPQKELDGLVAREVAGQKVILPVWHRVDEKTLRHYSPLLADRVATSTDKGVDAVVADLMSAMK